MSTDIKTEVAPKNDSVRFWIVVVGFVCLMVTYVWNSSAKIQKTESRSLTNKDSIEQLENRIYHRLDRIENKIDLIISKQ